MCHIVGVGDASMAADKASAGLSGELMLYNGHSSTAPVVLYEFDARVRIQEQSIHVAEAYVSVYLAHLMDNRFVHREIRRTLQNGGLQSATIWSDRQNNKADQYWRFCEIKAKYKDLYNIETELKWEQRSRPVIQKFDQRAKLARSLPIGVLSQWNGETKSHAFTWDFLNATFDKLKAPSWTVD